MTDLKVGDVVSFGDGPNMTVEDPNFNDTGKVQCVWFDKKDQLQREVFNATLQA